MLGVLISRTHVSSPWGVSTIGDFLLEYLVACEPLHSPNTNSLAGEMGFEPMMTISKTVALDRARRFPNKIKQDRFLLVELKVQSINFAVTILKLGSTAWARTRDQLINSQLLYRLSYCGIKLLEMLWGLLPHRCLYRLRGLYVPDTFPDPAMLTLWLLLSTWFLLIEFASSRVTVISTIYPIALVRTGGWSVTWDTGHRRSVAKPDSNRIYFCTGLTFEESHQRVFLLLTLTKLGVP